MVPSALRRQAMWKNLKGSKSRNAGTRLWKPATWVLSLCLSQCMRKSAMTTTSWRHARSLSRKCLSIIQWGHVTSTLFRSAAISTRLLTLQLFAALGLKLSATQPWLQMMMVITNLSISPGVKRFPRKCVLQITVQWLKVMSFLTYWKTSRSKQICIFF